MTKLASKLMQLTGSGHFGSHRSFVVSWSSAADFSAHPDKPVKGGQWIKCSKHLSHQHQGTLYNIILEDFENASPYFCTFLANRICD